MPVLQLVRGVQDLLPEEARQHHIIETLFRSVVERYGFSEIRTPILELTEVFSRTLGVTSDIVTKEMYTLNCGSESLALRPEGTAGVIRALITHGLHHRLPLKVYYCGPMFRHERPQKGRLRQFHQVGLELLGVDNPLADAEVISCAAQFLNTLGLTAVTLELNSLGDFNSRSAYRVALLEYLEQWAAYLSIDSRARLARNPLRILDSKDQTDQSIISGAPLLSNFLNAPSRVFFDKVCTVLETLRLDAKLIINPRLVRGLDYYNHTAFEFITEGLGTQSTVLAGGRYDGLSTQMGGPTISGIGWAAGVERLAMLYPSTVAVSRSVTIIPLGEHAGYISLQLAQDLRRIGIIVDMSYTGTLAKRMKRAHQRKTRIVIILGDSELKNNTALIRDLDSGVQEEISISNLVTTVSTRMA